MNSHRLAAAVLTLCCVLASPLAANAQGSSLKGTIRGRVIDESSGLGVPTALVEFMDGGTRVRGSAVSDSEGNFVLTGLPAGRFRLQASRIGYAKAITPYWRIQSGDVVTLNLYVDPDAVLLAPLEITAVERSRSPVLSGFYSRLERGIGGTFITRQEIEQRNPSQISDLLLDVPGVRLSSGGIGANRRVVSFTRGMPLRGGGCPVQIWIDGMLATRNPDAPTSLDELAFPGILEGIEIYRGLSTIPAEFVTPEARCGVIVLWTQRGG